MFKSSSSDEFTLSDLSRSKTQPPYWRFRAQLGKTFLLKRFTCISHRKNRTDLNLAILRGRLLIHFLLFPGFWTKIFPLVSIKVFIFVIMGLSNMTGTSSSFLSLIRNACNSVHAIELFTCIAF